MVPEYQEIRYFNEWEAEDNELADEGWYWWNDDMWLGPFSCSMAAEDSIRDWID